MYFFGGRFTSPHAGRLQRRSPWGSPMDRTSMRTSTTAGCSDYELGGRAVEDKGRHTDDWTRSRSNEDMWKLIHGFEAIPENRSRVHTTEISRIQDAPWREKLRSESLLSLRRPCIARQRCIQQQGLQVQPFGGGRCFCGGGDGGGL